MKDQVKRPSPFPPPHEHPLRVPNVYIPLVLPKQNSIFAFRIPLYDSRAAASSASKDQGDLSAHELTPQIEFELYGNQFRFRAAERAGRKFKHKETIEL